MQKIDQRLQNWLKESAPQKVSNFVDFNVDFKYCWLKQNFKHCLFKQIFQMKTTLLRKSKRSILLNKFFFFLFNMQIFRMETYKNLCDLTMIHQFSRDELRLLRNEVEKMLRRSEGLKYFWNIICKHLIGSSFIVYPARSRRIVVRVNLHNRGSIMLINALKVARFYVARTIADEPQRNIDAFNRDLRRFLGRILEAIRVRGY